MTGPSAPAPGRPTPRRPGPPHDNGPGDNGPGAADSRLPVPPGIARALVLAGVFVCAACGLVYELELIALADHLVGDTVTQTSVVLSLMVFAMGIGSLAAKRLSGRASANFALIEALLGLVGGSCAVVLCLSYVWSGEARWVLFGYALAIGVLIGAEMPLLMALIQRIREQEADRAVADLSAADYVGALLGGLAFPFLLLPLLGRLTAALVTGAVNAVAGGLLVLWLFRHDLTRSGRRRLLALNAGVIGVLLGLIAWVAPLERATDRALAEHAAGGGVVTGGPAHGGVVGGAVVGAGQAMGRSGG